ncbi:hypothetical protein KM043_007561 [Ampulex compressa]|nr:hypothetical protein KM043_007561 [Ampulex compressa]
MDNASVLWLLLFVTLINSGCSTHRSLRSWVNLGCGELCKDKNITTVYLRADGPNDTLHYLWDFGGNPSILLALTPPSSWINITWEDFIARKENSVTFSEEPDYIFGVVINKIIEFNDVNDTGVIDTANATNIIYLHPEYFRWERKGLTRKNEFVALDMEGNCYNDTAKNISRYGSINLSLRGFCTLDHSEIMPHMLHTENSTQVDIILNKFETTKGFSNSRFGIELLVVGGGNPDIPMFVEPKKSLDDEHTPGIFEVVEVRTPPYRIMDNYQSAGAYLQWRPVSYTNESRDVTSSIETVQYSPAKVVNRTSAIRNTMLYCYFGSKAENLLLQKITVSLGSKADGFYKESSYSTWTFIIGYGTAPEERFSYLVIMIMAIGLGLPLVIMLLVGLYICIRKMPKRHSDAYLSQ